MPEPLRALTLIRPWPWGIIHAGKPVENRIWSPPAALIGKHFAIHAGKKWDQEAAEDIACQVDILNLPPDATDEGIVAIVKLERVVRGKWDPNSPDPIISSEWFNGPVGWVLSDVVGIEPVPCRGARGLWPVPEDLLPLIRERWKAARHG